MRQLAKVDDEEALADRLVHSVNNTSLLLLDHAQLVREPGPLNHDSNNVGGSFFCSRLLLYCAF